MRIARCPYEQYQAAARRPWAHGGPKDSARSNGGAQKFCFKEFCYQISHGHRPPAQKPVHIVLAQLAQRASSLEHGPEITAAWIVNIGRREFQRVANDAANLFQRLMESRVSFCVFWGEFANLLRCALHIVVENQRVA